MTNLPWFYLAFLPLLLSIWMYFKGREKWAFGALLSAIAIFGAFTIQQFDFLFPWDERFHALVAKNVAEDFLHPRLYAERAISELDYMSWYKTHTWLHKQPWFSWQMGLSIKLFGPSIPAMRLPSLLMLLLFVISVYGGAKALQSNLAFPLAFSAGLHPFLFDFISGRQGMEHNDIAFLAWIAFSFWGLCLYIRNPRSWVALLMLVIGVSIAVLTKWLAGILVFGPWGLYLLLQRDFHWKSWLKIALCALAVAALVIPWQWHAQQLAPEVWQYEIEYNQRHLFEVIEGHSGSWYYHLHIWLRKFPLLLILLVLFVLPFTLLFQRKNNAAWAMIAGVLAVFVVFSLSVTKLDAYTLPALAPLYLSIAALSREALEQKFFWKALAVLFIAIGTMKMLWKNHAQLTDGFIEQLAREKVFFTDLKDELPERAVLLNVPAMKHVEIMYYTDALAYDFMPNAEQLQELKEKGYTPILLQNSGDTTAFPADIRVISTREIIP